jgi:hypothetical protein
VRAWSDETFPFLGFTFKSNPSISRFGTIRAAAALGSMPMEGSTKRAEVAEVVGSGQACSEFSFESIPLGRKESATSRIVIDPSLMRPLSRALQVQVESAEDLR